MDVLLLERLVPEAVVWLRERYSVVDRSQLPAVSSDLSQDLAEARAMVLPHDVRVSQAFLNNALKLELIGRLGNGAGNTDLNACELQGVHVLNSARASLHSTAEYILSGLLQLCRPEMSGGLDAFRVANTRGQATVSDALVGRELYGSTVGIFGLSSVVQLLVPMLQTMGVRVIGYDPAVHRDAAVWGKLRIKPMAIDEMLAESDFVCLQMAYASRHKHLVSERLLESVKPGQLWVSVGRSSLFEPAALAAALGDGRIAAALLDGAESDFLLAGSPLWGVENLYITPRTNARTQQAFTKASWYLARKIDEAFQATSSFNEKSDEPPTMPAAMGAH